MIDLSVLQIALIVCLVWLLCFTVLLAFIYGSKCDLNQCGECSMLFDGEGYLCEKCERECDAL